MKRRWWIIIHVNTVNTIKLLKLQNYYACNTFFRVHERNIFLRGCEELTSGKICKITALWVLWNSEKRLHFESQCIETMRRRSAFRWLKTVVITKDLRLSSWSWNFANYRIRCWRWIFTRLINFYGFEFIHVLVFQFIKTSVSSSVQIMNFVMILTPP
jgi:hypothetical protein